MAQKINCCLYIFPRRYLCTTLICDRFSQTALRCLDTRPWCIWIPGQKIGTRSLALALQLLIASFTLTANMNANNNIQTKQKQLTPTAYSWCHLFLLFLSNLFWLLAEETAQSNTRYTCTCLCIGISFELAKAQFQSFSLDR